MWRLALVAAVLTAMVFAPSLPDIRVFESPGIDLKPMAALRLETVTPTFGLSRAPISAYATAHKPLEGIRICIDAGHGGQEQWDKVLYCGGTRGVATGQTESDVNLRVSLLLRQYLEAAGAQIVMTRTSDDRCTGKGSKGEELDYRPNLANSKNSDFFVSIHHNEGVNANTNYTLVFYPKGMESAAPLAENIASAVTKYLGTQPLGARSGSYRILQKIKMPGILVEASFMSNPAEDLRLQSLAYNKLEAKAIATGILNYFRLAKGRQVDFNNIFAPIDDQAQSAQAIADASFVRKQIIEKRSLFGIRYEEVTCDASGQVVSRRDIGGNSLSAQKKTAGSKNSKVTASSKSKKSPSKSSVSKKSTSSASKSSAKSTKITPAKSKKSTKVASASSGKTKKAVVK
jgi:N-acetylmuramoyl-L-alanine amidase